MCSIFSHLSYQVLNLEYKESSTNQSKTGPINYKVDSGILVAACLPAVKHSGSCQLLVSASWLWAAYCVT